ncbi:MAG TPA: TIGR02300 family protein [Caulobacteraceae bacterium]|nr:TIGR02300 family protein [Caulobacteraceae bacterium]
MGDRLVARRGGFTGQRRARMSRGFARGLKACHVAGTAPEQGFWIAFDSGPDPWQGAAAQNPAPIRGRSLANPELGAKQLCPNCSSKFYDLGRRPAHCPKCATEFDPEEALRNRRVRARPLAPEEVVKPPAPTVGEEGYEAEPEEAPELDAGVDEPVLLSDDDESEDAAVPASGPDESLGVDFAEDDELEAGAEDDEVPFIEDEDDGFSDDEIDGLPQEGKDEDR